MEKKGRLLQNVCVQIAFLSALSLCIVLVINGGSFSSLPDAQLTGFVDVEGTIGSGGIAITSDLHRLAKLDKCDLSQGEWISDVGPLPYTTNTCKYIEESRQNCVRNGRPDTGYLHWKWKPVQCELPPFDPALFLHLMRGKTLALIGDSLARNHMESLLCALVQVEDPANMHPIQPGKEFMWHFPRHNFTLWLLWSPFLVQFTQDNRTYTLYLDIPEIKWARQVANYDIAVLSTGYWYHRPSLYYVDDKVFGANLQSKINATILEVLDAMRIAVANVLKYMTTEFKGITMLRTVTVDHFENGSFGTGGSCSRTKPFRHEDGDIREMPWMLSEMNRLQVEEFDKAAALVNGSSKLALLNVTYSALLRPDGHPGPHRVRQPSDPVNDCLHWCLPGPIDAWNQFLLERIAALL